MEDNPSAQIQRYVNHAVQEKLFTHAYWAIGRVDGPEPDLEGEHCPDGRQIFDLGSITKGVVTAPLVHELLHESDSSFGTTISGLLQENQSDDLHPRLLKLTCEQLLSHHSGLPAWHNFWVGCAPGSANDLTRQERMTIVLNRVARRMDRSRPYLYSDPNYILLGLVLETKFGKPLNEIQHERLRVSDDPGLFFGFACDIDPRVLKERAVPTGVCKVRGRDLVGEVYDENCWALGGVSGHAGVFASGRGLIELVRRLVKEPMGSRYVRANAARLGSNPEGMLLGFRQGNSKISSCFGSGRALVHFGFTGTTLFLTVDPEGGAEHYAVLLTNRTVSGRTNGLGAISELRREVFTQLECLRQAPSSSRRN